MKSYFRLNPYSYFVKSKLSACLYDTIRGNMISLKPENSHMLELSETNVRLSNIENTDMDFYIKLSEMGLGDFYKRPVYIEKAILGINGPMKKIIKDIYTIRNVQIGLTSKCNLNCKFCIDGDNTLFRKTGCKRWREPLTPLELFEWKNLITQVSKLGCQEITFVGGEPLLEFDLICNLIEHGKNVGITRFTIFSNGTLIDREKTIYFNRNNVKVIIQLLSFSEAIYDDISGVPGTYNRVNKCLEKMKALDVDFTVLFIVNKFNDGELEKVNDFTEKVTNRIIVDYIYPKPNNEYYSTKFIDAMYSKNGSFIGPTLPSFMYLRENNCCYGDKIAISSSGDVFPCIMSRKLKLGNIKETKEFYKLLGDNYYYLKSLSKEKIEGCSECAYRYGCLECRALEMSATGKINGMEYCNVNKQTEKVEKNVR